jgi:signal peptidase II
MSMAQVKFGAGSEAKVPAMNRASAHWLWLSLAVIALDQASKLVFLDALQPFERVAVIPGLFDWTLTFNQGVAFSIFGEGGDLQRMLLSGFALLVCGGLTWWLLRLPRSERITAAALALVIGGAIGNVIDRVRLGHVVDFVLLYWREWHWPAFNLADSCIVVGAIVIVIAGFFEGRAERAR